MDAWRPLVSSNLSVPLRADFVYRKDVVMLRDFAGILTEFHFQFPVEFNYQSRMDDVVEVSAQTGAAASLMAMEVDRRLQDHLSLVKWFPEECDSEAAQTRADLNCSSRTATFEVAGITNQKYDQKYDFLSQV